jgi:choline dehydrogenase-like flavoprotein
VLIDARELAPGAQISADICVIGTGAAGTPLALELTKAGYDVALLEAGGKRTEPEAQQTLHAGAGGSGSHDPLEMVRQKRLGGTTMQWGGRCTPLDEVDFESRPHIAHSGWPISRADLDPFYQRAHDYLDLGAFEYALSEACADTATIFADKPGTSAVIDDDRVWRWGPPVKMGRRYLPDLTASTRIRLYLHANVVELIQEAGRREVQSVKVASRPGRYFHVRARAFVVAAGGLESARLLLTSTENQPEGLGSSSDWLGRGYTTHPVAELGYLQLNDPGRGRVADFVDSRDGVYCRRQLAIRSDVQRREGLINVGFALWYPDPMNPEHGDGLLSAFALARNAMTRSQLNWKARGTQRRFREVGSMRKHLSNVAGDLPRLTRYGGYWVRRRYLSKRALPSFLTLPRSGGYRLRFDAEQTPDRDNRVQRSNERDAFGVPRLALHFRVSTDDRLAMHRSLELLGEEFARLGVGTLMLPPASQLAEEQVFEDGTHQMGLTRMSSSPASGVVDRDLRLWDAPNVFVASSAVFPTSGACGPTLTITALAIRLADHLSAELSAP